MKYTGLDFYTGVELKKVDIDIDEFQERLRLAVVAALRTLPEVVDTGDFEFTEFTDAR